MGKSKSASETETSTELGIVRRETRNIRAAVKVILWGRAGGRCEFAGCNKPLWKSPTTQEQVNLSQFAHIYSFSIGGPRGRQGIPIEMLNDAGNLILVCYDCHRKIDSNPARYPATLVQSFKVRHEERIEGVTAIGPDMQSHVLLYGANIGSHGSPLNYNSAATALFPNRFPASDKPIELGMINSSANERDDLFWSQEATNLRRQFEKKVRDEVRFGRISHLSVFGLAPQPLLILLGSLLGDIVEQEIFQRHREPPTWSWPEEATWPEFEVRYTPGSGEAALVIALSGHVASDRITHVLGPDARIWTVTVPQPHNDVIKSRAQLAELRKTLRLVLNDINAGLPTGPEVHIFPAAGVSAAIELGRIRMPKADLPWRVYDQVRPNEAFQYAISIGPEGDCR